MILHVMPNLSKLLFSFMWSEEKSKFYRCDVKVKSCVECVCSQFRGRADSATPWTVAHQAPPSMELFSKRTGVGCCFLCQGIFPTQASKLQLLCLLHCREESFPLYRSGKPLCKMVKSLLYHCEEGYLVHHRYLIIVDNILHYLILQFF